MNRPANPKAIPIGVMAALDRWLTKGSYPGLFLRSVLENNLKDALLHAHDDSLDSLPDLMSYLLHVCPGAAWGSATDMALWAALPEEDRLRMIPDHLAQYAQRIENHAPPLVFSARMVINAYKDNDKVALNAAVVILERSMTNEAEMTGY